MSDIDRNETAVVAADSGGFEMEVFVPDGSGGTRSVIVNGRADRSTLRRCQNHFIAQGVCVDCSRAAARLVWAT